MASAEYKNTDLLKFLPFYTSKIQKSIKKPRIKKEVIKKPKISNKELSQALPFHPKKIKNSQDNKYLVIFFHFLKK